MFRYFTMFILITLLGYLYERYKYKQESNEELAKYDMVKKFLLNDNTILTGKPILWIFNNYQINSRWWPSFFSRNTKKLNQPYLELCVESIVKYCGESFNVCLIDEQSFSKLIPDWNVDFRKLADPVKAHMQTLGIARLLYYYGGLVIPNSTIVLKDLKPLFNKSLLKNDCFTFEIVDRNSTSTYTSFFPTTKFIGCRQRAPIIKAYIDFLDKVDVTDYTSEQDFLGQADQYLFKECQDQRMTLVSGAYIGTRTTADKPVYIDSLLGSSYIPFCTDKLSAIYIPSDEILARTKFQWFARQSRMQALQSDTIIGKYLLISQASK